MINCPLHVSSSIFRRAVQLLLATALHNTPNAKNVCNYFSTFSYHSNQNDICVRVLHILTKRDSFLYSLFCLQFFIFLFIILLYNCLFLYIKKTLKYWKLEKKNYWRNLKTSAFCAKICFTWFYLLLSLWATAGAWKENLLFYYLLYCSYRKKPPENRSHFSFLFFKEFEIENISKKVESKENL